MDSDKASNSTAENFSLVSRLTGKVKVETVEAKHLYFYAQPNVP